MSVISWHPFATMERIILRSLTSGQCKAGSRSQGRG
jgi:hypothetical protein